MRYTLYHPGETRPSLVVQTEAEAAENAVDVLRRTMFDLGCPNGLLFDEHRCLILRDQFWPVHPSSIRVESEIPTESILLTGSAASLGPRVERWLGQLANDWDSALPDDPALAAAFLPNIVSAASGSLLQPQSGMEARL